MHQINDEDPTRDKGARASLVRFLIMSFFGFLIFLTPITYEGSNTIIMGVLITWAQAPFAPVMLELVVGFVCLSAVGGAYHRAVRPDWAQTRPLLHDLCATTPAWLGLRIVGAVLGVMVLTKGGPEVFWAEDTGTTVFSIIGPALLFTVGTACILLPLLTDFGFLEFTGTMLRRPFEALFTLPGRAAIDATSSIVAAASVGLLITIRQYEDGYYSTREAASVATNFSIVSLPFSLVIAITAGIGHMFFTWYLTVVAACLLCAAVMVRLPPLKRLSDSYFPAAGKQVHEEREADVALVRWALQQAVLRAGAAPALPALFMRGARTALVTLFRITGPSMAIATLTSVLVFHTQVFDLIAWPVAGLLSAAGLPEAQAAAPGFLVGFFEQFTPAVIASGLEDEAMRFILAGLSVSQLIYMSEVGVIILRSPLPLRFRDLVTIFVLRTLILFPIFLVAARLLV